MVEKEKEKKRQRRRMQGLPTRFWISPIISAFSGTGKDFKFCSHIHGIDRIFGTKAR